MFKWLKGWVDWVKTGDSGNNPAATIKLPIEHLMPTVERYEGESRRIPVQIVVIYNVKELASEIAKCLKNEANQSSESAHDGREGNNDGK